MTPPPSNIAHEFATIARAHPDLPAIIARDITLPYGKLAAIAEAFAARMIQNGIGPGATVALDTSDVIAAIANMLATARIGARFAGISKDLLDAGLATHLLKTPDRPGRPDLTYIDVDRTWSPKYFTDAATHLKGITYPDPDLPWWILHTSATTGAAKFMDLSQKAVFDRSMAVTTDFHAFKTSLCLFFACNTRPFYVRVTAALLNSCRIVDSYDPAFMAQHGVNLVCGAPAAAVEWVRTLSPEPRFKRLQVSGAPLHDDDARLLLTRFETVEDVYGSSETNKSFSNRNTLVDGALHQVGQPADSDLEIVDDAGQPVAPGVLGVVRVRNGYCVRGYIDRPEATERAFRDGWFYPGDLASWGDNGTLQIKGRVDEVINLSGRKIDPLTVERSLMSVKGVAMAACFVDPTGADRQKMMAFVTLTDRFATDDVVPRAHAACLAANGAAATPQTILVVDAIPLTNDGIPRRGECAEMARHTIKNLNPST